MVEEFSEARIAVLKYRVSDDPTFRNELNLHLDNMFEAQSKLEANAAGAAHIEQLKLLESESAEYRDAFETAYSLQVQKNAEIEKLKTFTADLARDLQAIITVVRGDFDSTTAITAETIQKNIAEAEAFGQRFLVANDPADAEKAVQALQPALKVSETLVSGLINPDRTPLAESIVGGLQGYSASFAAIVQLINEQNGLYSNRLDVIGPSILTRYNEIFRSVADTQGRLGVGAADAIGDTQRNTIFIGVAIGLFAAFSPSS